MPHPLRLGRFIALSQDSLKQASAHPGNLHAATHLFGVRAWSLTVWQDTAAMQDYARTGAHLQAMREISKVALASRFHRYPSDVVPSFAEARAVWLRAGRAD
ncbi:hypothetical protein [Palleronia sp. THAF1]|uniref:hypothetical protein n=1 Tax=Palleronia sp. THAF1 TaxID=2587842 RepID=UPI000F5260A6|nr:hypothetical protein [Palleronia sp. THAF1]